MNAYHMMKQKVSVTNIGAGAAADLDLGADADKYEFEVLSMVAASTLPAEIQGLHDIAAGAPAADAASQQLTTLGRYCFSVGKKTAGNTNEVYRYLKVFCPVASRVTVSRWFRG